MSASDRYVSASIRQRIEERYYARINEQARLENLIHDPAFVNLDGRHAALFADHGVIHIRDVARQVLATLDNMHGVLLPFRPSKRLTWMREYGFVLALLHDIGMVDFSIFGRKMHPEVAAQAVFSGELEDVIELIWRENDSNFVNRLEDLSEEGVFSVSPKLILRELLAISMGHSKGKVPIDVVNDPLRFRQLMIEAISIDLRVLYRRQQRSSHPPKDYSADQDERNGLSSMVVDTMEPTPAMSSHDGSASQGNPAISSFYDDADKSAFQWMISPHPLAVELLEDVTDTIRVLRCADALRQRGTVLKTSGSYEVFVDQRTANAVYALRKGDEQLILLEMPDTISAGEANIASSQLDLNGDLRISFHRGSFSNPGAVDHAAYCAAVVVQEIIEDVIYSFERIIDSRQSDLKPAAKMKILLEDIDDNLDFTALVSQHLRRISPDMVQEIEAVPSLQIATEFERELYLSASSLDWDSAKRCETLAQIGRTGHLVTDVDLEQAFNQVKHVSLLSGQNLLEAGGSSAFVYIPLQPGLKIIPLGGYQAFMAEPWVPIGITGAIRGVTRNATIAAAADLDLLMIPKSIYLHHWYQTYSQDEFRQWLQKPGTD